MIHKKRKRIIYDILIVAVAAVMLYCGYRFFAERHELNVTASTYEKAAAEYTEKTDQVTKTVINGEEKKAYVSRVDFDSLRKTNENVVAWLTLDDTVIDYPIVQGEDNDYWLHHLFDGTKNRCGTLFIDSLNASDFSDSNTIIYGHYLMIQTMFYTLKYYAEQDFYEEHPIMMLYTPTQDYRVEIFASEILNGYSGFPMTFSSEEEYQEWIDEIRSKSDIESDVVMNTDDKMVTLYTCAYTFENAKRLVFGKLVPLESDGDT